MRPFSLVLREHAAYICNVQNVPQSIFTPLEKTAFKNAKKRKQQQNRPRC
jgi:hypothetical protein